MDSDIFLAFQIASTFSVVPPLLIGVVAIRQLKTNTKLFILFLLVGFIADLLGWHFYLTKNVNGNIYTRDFYSLIEALFLLWFIADVTNKKIVKSIFGRAWIILIPIWLTGIVYKDLIIACRTAVQVLLAFGSCICLLEMIEGTVGVSKHSTFWILLGIFFYFFSTFFFMGLLATQLGLKVWYLHNFINIATNLIYCWAFARCIPLKTSQQ